MSDSLTPSSSCPIFSVTDWEISYMAFGYKPHRYAYILQMHETTGGCTLWPIAGWCLTNDTILCYLIFKLCHIVDTCPASALSFPSLWLELQMMGIYTQVFWMNWNTWWNCEKLNSSLKPRTLWRSRITLLTAKIKAASRHPYKRYSYVPMHHDGTAHCNLHGLDAPNPNLGKLFKMHGSIYRWLMHF